MVFVASLEGVDVKSPTRVWATRKRKLALAVGIGIMICCKYMKYMCLYIKYYIYIYILTYIYIYNILKNPIDLMDLNGL